MCEGRATWKLSRHFRAVHRSQSYFITRLPSLRSRWRVHFVCDIAQKIQFCVVVHLSNRGIQFHSMTVFRPLAAAISQTCNSLRARALHALFFGESVLISPSIAAMTTGQKSIAFRRLLAIRFAEKLRTA